jgi:hypothetical protein
VRNVGWIFSALAHSTRRAVFRHLALGEATVGRVPHPRVLCEVGFLTFVLVKLSSPESIRSNQRCFWSGLCRTGASAPITAVNALHDSLTMLEFDSSFHHRVSIQKPPPLKTVKDGAPELQTIQQQY